MIVHGDGTSLWTVTHNSDFAKGFTGLMGNPMTIGEAFQITSDQSVTWNQIYQAVADALHVEYKPYYVSSAYLDAAGPYDFEGALTGDKANTVVFDNKKLKNAVPGLCMNVRMEQGIRNTVDYVLSHPECQVEDPEFDAWCDKPVSYTHLRKEAEGFYHKLGYITREDMNPDTLELKKPSDPVREVRDPRFVCVYMEKQL